MHKRARSKKQCVVVGDERYIQYCAKVMQTKFVEIVLCSRDFSVKSHQIFERCLEGS